MRASAAGGNERRTRQCGDIRWRNRRGRFISPASRSAAAPETASAAAEAATPATESATAKAPAAKPATTTAQQRDKESDSRDQQRNK